jgi:hypothetical protein
VTLQAALLGMIGAALVECMRVIACLRVGRAPSGLEWAASLLSVLLGLGVLLFDTANESRLQIAVLGAAFPQIFSGLVAVSKPPSEETTRGVAASRTLADYISWSL